MSWDINAAELEICYDFCASKTANTKRKCFSIVEMTHITSKLNYAYFLYVFISMNGITCLGLKSFYVPTLWGRRQTVWSSTVFHFHTHTQRSYKSGIALFSFVCCLQFWNKWNYFLSKELCVQNLLCAL